MNENQRLRLWKWSVLVLILCNIALIVTIWVKPNLRADRRPESPRDFVIRNLKFSDDQIKKYDVLISAHQNSMQHLRKEMIDYRSQLFDNLKNMGGSGISADSLSQLVGNDQKQIELVTYNHFAQVRAICTDAQKIEFDKIIGDVTKMMGPKMHRGGDGQGPPPEREGNGGPPENE